MLQAQADRVHSGVSGQPGPVCRIRPANRRRPSPPQLPARSEGVRIRLNQYRSNCHSGCRCICHVSQKAATPGFMDRVLGQLFVGYSGLPILSSKCDKKNCPGQRGILVSSWILLVANCTVTAWIPTKYRSSDVIKHTSPSARLCALYHLCIEWRH